MPIKAIDISIWQKNVDFEAVKKSGVSTVIIRNGYLNKTDEEFTNHMKGALAAGFDIGTYTYLTSTTPEQARKEARQTVKRLEKYKGSINYPVFADMEDNRYATSNFDKTSRTQIMLAFLDEIEKSGYYSGVYINPIWLESYVDKKQILGRYDIWLAAWTENPNRPTRFQYGQTIWQWGKGTVKGVSEEVDSDLIYCDYPAKIRSQKKNFLPQYKAVTLAFNAAVRSRPSASSKKVGLLTAGTKCVIVEGTDTLDPDTEYVYVQLAGGKSQWIVKSAIAGGTK